jgi:peptide/nickel transport system ATP-binding protein
VLELLKRLRRDFGSSIILITHDMGVVGEMADRVLVMYAGRVVEQGRTEDIFDDPWHPYTWGLLASIPPLHGKKPLRLTSIPGTPPTPANLPPGCSFAPRCRWRFEPCLTPPPRRSEGERATLCFIDPEEREALRRTVLPVTGDAA